MTERNCITFNLKKQKWRAGAKRN